MKKQFNIFMCIGCLIISVICIICLIINYYKCSGNEYKGKNYGTIYGFSLDLDEDIPQMEDFEITDEMAIDIGNAVIKSVSGKNEINKTEYSLEYYISDGVYLFSRSKPDFLDGGYEVIIRKKDGAILKVSLSAG